MASLMAMNFGGSDLDKVLSAHLNFLAISPMAKQAIIPVLLRMVKITKVHAHTHTGVCTSLAGIPSVCASLLSFLAPALLSHRL